MLIINLVITPDQNYSDKFGLECNVQLWVTMELPTGVCTTEYHSTTEYQFFYFSYKIWRKHAIYFIFVNIY
jgi:hypothetical protein